MALHGVARDYMAQKSYAVRSGLADFTYFFLTIRLCQSRTSQL